MALSADGAILVAGEPGYDTWKGGVRVYDWNDAEYVARAPILDNTNGILDDSFGWTVALSHDGNTVAIGSPYNDPGGVVDAGHVRVFAWGDASWNQLGTDFVGTSASAHTGCSVALSSDGTVLAVGGSSETVDGDYARGTVRVHVWEGGVWNRRGLDLEGDAANDHYGWAVALSDDGSVLAVGAKTGTVASGAGYGFVRVHAWDGDNGAWTTRGSDMEAEDYNDQMGLSLIHI